MIPTTLTKSVNPCSCGAPVTDLDLDTTSSLPDRKPMLWRITCHACGKRGAAMCFGDKAIGAWNMVNPVAAQARPA